MNTFTISASITAAINCFLFFGELFDSDTLDISFVVFLFEFCLGLIFFLPKSTREVARGMLVASSISVLVSLATCSYLMQTFPE